MRSCKLALAGVTSALLLCAMAQPAAADTDDNYPWSNQFQAYLGPLSVVSLASGYGSYVWGGPDADINSTTDVDYYLMTCGAPNGANATVSSVGISFNGANGDLDIAAYTLDGKYIGYSAGVGDTETISVAAQGKSVVFMKVYGYRGAVNSYGFKITCQY